ncbi:MAG: VCBS repeat-containing protein [Pseudomonadales bacterium]|nr:VCBS repeat-containing protein [Pseudomonadales bacterium]
MLTALIYCAFSSPEIQATELDFAHAVLPISNANLLQVIPFPGNKDRRAGLVVINSNQPHGRILTQYALHNNASNSQANLIDEPPFDEPQWQEEFHLTLGDEMQFFDVAQIGGKAVLLAYAAPRVFMLDTRAKAFIPLVVMPSIYKTPLAELSLDAKMVFDVNNDGLDDLLLPGFEGWRVAIQSPTGDFNLVQLLGPQPLMSMESNTNVYYRALMPFFMDYNRDGQHDLAFMQDGQFSIYNFLANGRYAATAIMIDPNIPAIKDDLYSISFNSKASDHEDEQRLLTGIADFDGDGNDDLLITQYIVQGVFGIRSQLNIHLGFVAPEGQLSFPVGPNSSVNSGGIQFNHQLTDIENDGRLEILTTSVDFSVATIIRALLTRSVSMDIGVYRMSEGHYPKSATVKRQITASVSFAESKVFVPAIYTADITGDGIKDLLVQQGTDEMQIFTGNGKRNLFARKPVRLKLSLPKQRDDIQLLDLDGNGRADLLMVLQQDELPDGSNILGHTLAPSINQNIKYIVSVLF